MTLKSGLWVIARSLEMAPFDRWHTSSYSSSIVTIIINIEIVHEVHKKKAKKKTKNIKV